MNEKRKLFLLIFLLLLLISLLHIVFISVRFSKVEIKMIGKMKLIRPPDAEIKMNGDKLELTLPPDKVIKFYSTFGKEPSEKPSHIIWVGVPAPPELAEGIISVDEQRFPIYLKDTPKKIQRGESLKIWGIVLTILFALIFVLLITKVYMNKSFLTFLGGVVLAFLTLFYFIFMQCALLSSYFNISFLRVFFQMLIFIMIFGGGEKVLELILFSESKKFKMFLITSFITLFLIAIIPLKYRFYHLFPFLLFILPIIVFHPTFKKREFRFIPLIIYLVGFGSLILLLKIKKDQGFVFLLLTAFSLQFIQFLLYWLGEFRNNFCSKGEHSFKIALYIFVLGLILVPIVFSFLFQKGILSEISRWLFKGRQLERIQAIVNPFYSHYTVPDAFKCILILKHSKFLNLDFSHVFLFRNKYLITDMPLYLIIEKMGWVIGILVYSLKTLLFSVILIKTFQIPYSFIFKRISLFTIPILLFITFSEVVPLLGAIRITIFTGVPSFLMSYSFFLNIFIYLFVGSFLHLEGGEK